MSTTYVSLCRCEATITRDGEDAAWVEVPREGATWQTSHPTVCEVDDEDTPRPHSAVCENVTYTLLDSTQIPGMVEVWNYSDLLAAFATPALALAWAIHRASNRTFATA